MGTKNSVKVTGSKKHGVQENRHRKRGRPLQSQEQEITDSIVRSAYDLFLESGYGGTSMKKIGEKAGVSSGTLYSRFPDKSSLFTAVVNRQVSIWEIETPAGLEKPRETVFEVLLAGALGMMEAGMRPDLSAFFRLLNSEASKFPELARIYHDNAIRVGYDILFEALMRTPEGTAKGKTVIGDLAQTMIEAVNGWLETRILLNELNISAAAKRKAALRIARVISGS